MSDVALGSRDTLHQPELVELDHWLRKIKINGTPPLALAIEDHRQIAHKLEDAGEIGVALAHAGIALQYRVHAGVGHTLCRANNAWAELIADDLTLVIDFHDAGHHQTLNLRAQ